MSTPRDDVLGHSEVELKRLASQARLIDPITKRFFQSAGIGDGMRILDRHPRIVCRMALRASRLTAGEKFT
ncbi:MAG: hypothetical protein JO312_26220 [Hyphomicrobiales bacterium]|nr:hypothetical protein [Hyphomicrobiales bacterium]